MQSPTKTCARLSRIGMQIRLANAGRWLLAGVAVYGALLLLFAGLDRVFRFGPAGRWTGFALTLLPLFIAFVMAFFEWNRRRSLDAVARYVEKASPGGGGDNPLVSLVQFNRLLPASSSLRSALIREIKDPFPQINWGIVFNTRRMVRAVFGMCAILLVATIWGAANPKTMGNAVARLALPGSEIAPLTFTKLVRLSPGDETIVHGSSVDIRAELGGTVPQAVWLRYREDGGAWQKVPMKGTSEKGSFSYEFPKVFASFVYEVVAADLVTGQKQIHVIPRTAVSSIKATVTPPVYSKHLPTTVDTGTVLPEVVPGSKINLEVTFNNPITGLAVAGMPGNDCPPPVGGPRTWKMEIAVARSETLNMKFLDAAGRSSSQTLEVRTAADTPPEIAVESPPEGTTVLAKPGDFVDIRFKAADKEGIAKVALMEEDPESGKMTLVHLFPDAAGKIDYAGAWSMPVPAKIANRGRLTYKLLVEDGNIVTGPGTAASPAIVIAVTDAAGTVAAGTKAKDAVLKGFGRLVELQEDNLHATSAARAGKDAGVVPTLLSAQSEISDSMIALCSGLPVVSEDVRQNLQGILRTEMPRLISTLRDATSARTSDALVNLLTSSESLESLVLAKLKGTSAAASKDGERKEVGATISALENLLFRQRDLYKQTKGALPERGPVLSGTQDELATAAGQVRSTLLSAGKSASTGDGALRDRLLKVSELFDQNKISDNMFRAAEQLDSRDVSSATATELSLVENLSEMVKFLNEWQISSAAEAANETASAAEEMKAKLELLATIQQAVVEKSKELSRKNATSLEDRAVVAEIQQLKAQIQQVTEQMVTDLHTFPDIPATEKLMVQLSEIVEKVEQSDTKDAESGEVKTTTFDMEKEESILKDLEAAAQAGGLEPQAESWAADANDPNKMRQEAYDANEFPEIPDVPLPDTYQDTVGELLKGQDKVDNDDTATNKFSATASGGMVGMEGDMATMSGMGQSGTEKPSHSEQSGRSTGGRSGMATGEMNGSVANNFEGDRADARLTGDSQQRRYVEDPAGMQETAATGGGKGSGLSDRTGMEGDGVVQSASAPGIAADSARAAAQAQLAEKASLQAAKAEMFYINADGMKEVARLMDANASAIREGRTADSKSLHQQIVTRLRQMQGGLSSGTAVLDGTVLSSKPVDTTSGGDEGRAPENYRDQVADYFRHLSE